MPDTPLHGVRVLDLSRVLAGPYCTLMLADLGADVVKVEPPLGDETRRFGPPFIHGESTYFLSVNRGKRSIALDLKTSAGRAIVHRLAAWADVVVQNFHPGDPQRLGVDYDTLAQLNPRLVYASISGYGQRGVPAYARLPGYDLVIQGVGGIASLTGAAAGKPHKVGTSVADLVAGLNAFGAIMVALFQRHQTGLGQHIDISMLDGQLSLLTYQASSFLHTGVVPQRLGNAHPSICPYEVFATADGHVSIACGNDGQFQALCGALDLPDLPHDARYRSNAQRVENRQTLVATLSARLQRDPTEHWLTHITDAGIPCGPIFDVAQALAHPQAHARGMRLSQPHPTVGTTYSVGTATGAAMGGQFATRPPPRLGEHGEDVLRSVLGMDAEAVRQAMATGAVGAPPGEAN